MVQLPPLRSETDTHSETSSVPPLTFLWGRCFLFSRPRGRFHKNSCLKEGEYGKDDCHFYSLFGCLLFQRIGDNQMGQVSFYQWTMLEPPSVHTSQQEGIYNEWEQNYHQPQAGVWPGPVRRVFFVLSRLPQLSPDREGSSWVEEGERGDVKDLATHSSLQVSQAKGVACAWGAVGQTAEFWIKCSIEIFRINRAESYRLKKGYCLCKSECLKTYGFRSR